MRLVFFCLFVLFSCTKSEDIKTYYPHLKWDDLFRGHKITVDKEFQNKKVSGMKAGFEGKLKGHFLITEMMVNVDPETASQLFKNKAQLIKGLYMNQEESSACVAGLNVNPLVQDKKNQTALQFDLKATERLVVGVCDEDQNIYRNQTLLIYCKNISTFYDLKYFYPKGEKPLAMPIASCF